jgi:hypothetical protein
MSRLNLFYDRTKTSYFSGLVFCLLQSAASVTAGPDGPEHKHANFVPKSSVSTQLINCGEGIHGLFAGFDRLQIPRRFQNDISLSILIVFSYGMVDRFQRHHLDMYISHLDFPVSIDILSVEKNTRLKRMDYRCNLKSIDLLS